MSRKLFDAVQFQDELDVRRLLDSDHTIDINAVGGYDSASDVFRLNTRTALGIAAFRGHTGVVALLLDRGADVNTVGGKYATALGMAAYWGYKEILTLLLDRGADINIVGGTYGTALGVAAYEGHKGIVTFLLDRGADVNTVGGMYGTALGVAACKGDEGIVALLLDRGADVNVVSCTEYGTVLGVAAYWGKEGIVSLLLDRGADVNTVGGTYGTAMSVAAHQRLRRIVALLLDRGADINAVSCTEYGTALGVAAYKGHRGIVTLLLDRGADVNTVGGKYGTALGVAIYWGKEGIVTLLLDRGADINIIGGTYGTALGVAVSRRSERIIALLLDRGADVNAVSCTEYGTALGVAAYKGHRGTATLLLDRGADVNTVGGTYGTALGAAVFRWSERIVALLLDRGAGVNTVGGKYGTVLGVAVSQGHEGLVTRLLDQGADINTVCGKYGTTLGLAVYQGNEKMVALLLGGGADTVHVGGNYETAQGEYPTALDAARAGNAAPGLFALVAHAVEKGLRGFSATDKSMNANHSRMDELARQPPFPIPYTRSYTEPSVYPLEIVSHRCQQTEVPPPAYCGLSPDTIFHVGDVITPEQANFPCEALNGELLGRMLVALIGINTNEAEEPRAKCFQRWIRNDIRYFLSQKFDFGLAYSAARVGWKHFNGTADDTSISVQRARWLKKAKELDEARTQAIYKHSSTGQELIKSPYSVMPRRIWDLKSNRVVEYRMLHSEIQSTDVVRNDPHTQSPLHPPFWAITHSWTDGMKPLAKTPINQYQWPVPLPEGVDLERDVRTELLSFGAEYVWLDVLCLRQHSGTQKPSDHNSPLDFTKQTEWKIDVPTIGNIYRAAERVVRYFNGLGKPFSEHGWDDSRHWLRRAWTLQEISTEDMTFNGGIGMSRDNKRIILNTKGQIGGQTTTLRAAIRPILKLAASLGYSGGCSMYDLVREMSRRCASHPTDKVAGLFYLLHTTQLPTYDELLSDEKAWRKCFYVLPFRRKLEVLFDFPYRGPEHWYPSWEQLMMWPERDDTYEHAAAEWLHGCATSGLIQAEDEASLFVDRIWAISNVLLSTDTRNPGEYEVKIGSKDFGFYCPYQFQKSFDTENRQFTLAIPIPQHSYNWVVCEEIPRNRKRKFEHNDKEENVVDLVELKKVGVLRTDSCSELLVGKRDGGSMLKMINCLFV